MQIKLEIAPFITVFLLFRIFSDGYFVFPKIGKFLNRWDLFIKSHHPLLIHQ